MVANVYADDNRGSAALTAAAIRAAQCAFPGCRVELVAVNDAAVGQAYRHTLARHPDVEVLAPVTTVVPGALDGIRAGLRSLRLLLRRPGPTAPETAQRIARADLLISRGGFLFVDYGRLRSVLSLWLTSFPLVLASRFGVPTATYATTVGPFRTLSARVVNRWILRRADLVLVRDDRSYREALGLGLDRSRVVQIPDSVFGLRLLAASGDGNPAAEVGLAGMRFGAITVVEGPTSGVGDGGLLPGLARLIRALLDAGVVDGFAVVVQVDGSLASDAAISAKLVDLVGDERVVLVREDWSPDQLVSFYAAAAFVIGCRLHSAIFSLLAGTPAFVVSVSGTKSEGVFESLGLERFVIAPDFAPDIVAREVARAVAEGEDLRARIRDIVAGARDEVDGAARLLRRTVHGRDGLGERVGSASRSTQGGPGLG